MTDKERLERLEKRLERIYYDYDNCLDSDTLELTQELINCNMSDREKVITMRQFYNNLITIISLFERIKESVIGDI